MTLFKQTQKGFTVLLCLFITNAGICQVAPMVEPEVRPEMNIRKKKERTKPYVGIEIASYMLPQAKIKKTEGKYKLRSRLQSAYEIGLNYFYEKPKGIAFYFGFHFIVGKINFFLTVPPEDTRVFLYPPDGSLILEYKELWGAFKFPFLFSKEFNTPKWGDISIRTGFNVMYSGLMTDLGIGGAVNLDSNYNRFELFSTVLKSNNNYKPWVTFTFGGGKNFYLKNKNILCLNVTSDISTTNFYKADYTITIPGQPVSTGTYRVNGTSLGLSLQYIFTGQNKKIIREYQKKGF
jgi:hypothetical protein